GAGRRSRRRLAPVQHPLQGWRDQLSRGARQRAAVLRRRARPRALQPRRAAGHRAPVQGAGRRLAGRAGEPGGVIHRTTGERVMGGHITRRLAIGLAGLALVVTTAACNRNQNAKAAAPPPPTEVIVAPVEQRTVSIVRDFTARTEAVPTVEVRA